MREELEKIDLKLEIRRNSDGVIATDVWKDWEYNDYWFEDGNASCDCNRWLFFERAIGNKPDIDNAECSGDKYSLRLSDNNTGDVLIDEFKQ